ncbi:hypothetical protein [Nonomuraea sp. NPDC049695]|uniref:hypothetical protein n=1 Tax=Nonomuraea sp. NPDC049695 TaxID=3154734 RepID=UPI0034190B8F
MSRSKTGLWVVLGLTSLALVIALGAAVGLVLRGHAAESPERAARPSGGGDPATVVVTDADVGKLVEEHGRALAEGDLEAFMSIFDRTNAALLRDQRRVFANLRKVPLTDVSYQVLRRQGRAEDNFGRAVSFIQDVAFVHRFSGIDLRPVAEWYRWTIEKASATAPLVVTRVGGAPPPALSGASKTMYYPAPWDVWPDISVVRANGSLVLARPEDAALATRTALIVAAAASDVRRFWSGAGERGAPVPGGYVVALAKGPAQLGNLFRKEKANEAGVAIPMPSWKGTEIGGTRIVVDTTSPFFGTTAGIREVVTHELAHALLAGVDNAEYSLFGKPKWIVEGFAEYVANRGKPIRSNLRYAQGRAYLAGRPPVRLPDNTFWDYKGMTGVNYLMGHLAMRHIAGRYGERKLVQGVVAAYRVSGDESQAALLETLGVSETSFERDWAAYVRRQLA